MTSQALPMWTSPPPVLLQRSELALVETFC